MGASSSTEAEREPLLVPSYAGTNSPVNSRVYGRRWLVLTLFSLLGLMQGMIWNFWGPIQNSAVQAYGFSNSDIAVLVLWGPVGFVPWLLFMWLMDKKGLRASLLLSAFFMLLGAALRSVPLPDLHLRRCGKSLCCSPASCWASASYSPSCPFSTSTLTQKAWTR